MNNVEIISLDDYRPAPYNPRVDLKSGDPEYKKLKRSMKELGYLELIVVNRRTKHIIAGHQRIKVLQEQGISQVEAVVVDFDESKEKAANLALNKIRGYWAFDKLAILLDELSKLPQFDIGLTGFDEPEIGRIFDRYLEPKDGDEFNFNAALESIEEPITKKGDLIQLGPHRVLCGDSSNPEDLKTLMGHEKADILDCDFPYNVNYGGGDKPNPNIRPKNSRRWPQIYSDNMPQAKYEAWMKEVLALIKEYIKPGGAIYIWQGLRQFPPMYQMLLDLGFHISCILVWLKESAALTYSNYCYRSEQCLYGWREGAPHYWAGKPGESNVWEVKRDPTKSYLHPTQKPVQLAQKALQNSSKINDIVLDTFLGSGSVLIGAESLGRRCFGLELDCRYCDVIVKRYIAYAGPDKVSSEILNKYCKETKDEK